MTNNLVNLINKYLKLAKNSQKGFITVALPVAITIIGLATASILGNNLKEIKVRDNQRHQDIVAITGSLKSYYGNKHSYPIQAEQAINGLESLKQVIKNVPQDPLFEQGWTYSYWSNGQSYTLRYFLEETKQEKVVFSN